MRVIFTSSLYLPLMGGTVAVADRWARELARQGHQVVVLTKTPGEGIQTYPEWEALEPELKDGSVTVCRFSGFADCRRLLKSADRVVIVEMSVKSMAAAFAARKRPLVTHHTHFNAHGEKFKPYRILQYLMGLTTPAVACSAMVATQWGPHVGVLPNPYEPAVFHPTNRQPDIDFLFVGRFVSDKGGLLFVDAVARLASTFAEKTGRKPSIGLAGNGPEEAEIRHRITLAELNDSVAHLGLCSPAELAGLYNRSRSVVIPSVWLEPFGLIALEALACGCKVVCSDQPGLRAASGGMAVYFETSSVEDLARAMLESAFGTRPTQDPNSSKLAAHLAQHRVENSAISLLERLERWNNAGDLNIRS